MKQPEAHPPRTPASVLRSARVAAARPEPRWRHWLDQGVARVEGRGFDLVLASLGAALLLAQPYIPLAPGLALLALPWLLRLAARAGIGVSPLDLPLALYLVSAGLGLLVTSDPPTATIRWWGLVAVVGLALLLARRPLGRTASLVSLWAMLVSGLAGALAVLVLTQGRLARGPVGRLLEPWFGWFERFPPMTEPVMQTNTRFIVSYNGFGDLCLLAITASVVLAGQTKHGPWRWLALAGASVVTLLLIATGGRGSLLGLAGSMLTLLIVRQAGAVAPGGSRRRFWTRARQPLALALGLLVLGGALGASGIIDKGFESSSVAGRIVFWRDLFTLLGDYGLTGLGLGMQAPLNAIVAYGITPYWDAMAYAHNMFVQTYLEQGPLGSVALGWFLAVPFICAARALGHQDSGQRAVVALGLAVLVGLTLHGLTDQVPTSNVGTLMLAMAASLVVAASRGTAPSSSGALSWRSLGLAVAVSLGLGLAVLQPREPASLLANLGAVEVARATNTTAYDVAARRRHAAWAEHLLTQALALSPDHPPTLRHLARLAIARYQFDAAAAFLDRATQSHRLTPFDAVQIGRLYYQIGFLEEGRSWTRWGYEAGGQALRAAAYEYERRLLDTDWRVRTLVEQAEDLRGERRYTEALSLFQQALQLAPGNRYLEDQIAELRRNLARQSGQP